jgi:hypothetical protein
MEVQCGHGFVLFEKIEKKKEGQWAPKKEDQSNLTP